MNPIISIITLTLNTPIKNTGIDRSIKNTRPECMMPYDPAIPLLGTFPRETKPYVHTKLVLKKCLS